MRKIFLASAMTVILAPGASSAYAMCGSNLSPSRTPYALLPQPAVADLSAPASVSVVRPARVKASPPPRW